MRDQKTKGWSRREFLGGLALAGTAAMIGLRPELGMAAVEPPPETKTAAAAVLGPGMLGAVLSG